MRIQITIALGTLATSALGADLPAPPISWERAFRDQRQEVWNRLLKDDGKVTANEVIEESYKGGSHRDGDRQLATAFALIQLADDPMPHLRKMMQEEKPERRAYAVLVAGLLGDSRLQSDIEGLRKDDAKLGQFPGDWFWDTVADASRRALIELKRGGVTQFLISNGGEVAEWLKASQRAAVEQAVPSTGDKPSK